MIYANPKRSGYAVETYYPDEQDATIRYFSTEKAARNHAKKNDRRGLSSRYIGKNVRSNPRRRRSDPKKLLEALTYMRYQILVKGDDYVDAEWKISQKFNILPEILRAAYDKLF